MTHDPESLTASRRTLLKGVVAATAVGVGAALRPLLADDIIPTAHADVANATNGPIPAGTTQAPGRVIGANDRINVAVIGVGNQGFGAHVVGLRAHAADLNVSVMGCCDVYEPRRERARSEMAKDPSVHVQAVSDYRRLLDNKDIDAVVIATPEHWHAQISLQAMDAGKHVYCEKPMSRYLDEAFQLVDAQKRTGKVFQLGIQFTSNPKFKAIGDYIRAGKIGPLVTGQGSYCRNGGVVGEWNYPIDANAGPSNLDWKTWLGSAPSRPWNDDARERFFRFRKYWDYSGGILTDLLPHKIGPLMVACGNPEYPTRVCCLGTRRISLDREVDDSVSLLAEFPSGWTMQFTGSTVNEQGLPDLFRGFKASVHFSGDAIARPERPFVDELEEATVYKGADTGIDIHHRNWVEAMRTGVTPNCPVVLGAQIQTILSLAEESSRTSRMMLFDAATRKVTAG